MSLLLYSYFPVFHLVFILQKFQPKCLCFSFIHDCTCPPQSLIIFGEQCTLWSSVLRFPPASCHTPFTSHIIHLRIYPQSVFFLKHRDECDCSKSIFTTKLNSIVSFRVIYGWHVMTKAQAYLRYFGIMTTESQNYQLSIFKTIRGVSAVGCSLCMVLRTGSDLSVWPSVSST